MSNVNENFFLKCDFLKEIIKATINFDFDEYQVIHVVENILKST